MSSPIKILAAVLVTHERTGWVCGHLSKWLTDFYQDQMLRLFCGKQLEYNFQVDYLRNFIPAASARNYFCRTMKDADPTPDWLMMIDNDMAPPFNLLDSVKDAPADAGVIVPRFSMWDETKAATVLCWGMNNPTVTHKGTREFVTIDQPGFYPLTKAGTGCIFIKPEVLKAVSMPYFWYPLNEDQGLEGTEDICFTEKVLKAGFKIYGNSRIAVGHYHNCNLEVVAHAIHVGQQEALEIFKKENGLTDSGKMGSVTDSVESPSPESALVASPACN